PVALYKLRNLTPSHYGRLFLSGLMGILIPSFLFAFAQTRLESAVTGIGNSLTPIFTLIIGAVLFRHQFHRSALLGILVGLAGTVLLILSRTGESISGINAYSLLIIVACLFYATNVNFIKYRIADVPSMTITSVSILLIGPFAMGYLFGATNFFQTMSATPGAWRAFGFVVVLGLMSRSIVTIDFNRLVKLSTP